MKSDAIFSKNKVYRYVLMREWNSTLPSIMFIGLNPSTADEKKNDPTIRRCIGFANRWNYGKMFVCNLFGYRATYPTDLFSYPNPIGSENDEWILKIQEQVDLVVLVYGNHGKKMNRHNQILDLIKEPFCIKVSKTGFPMHPLYLKYTDQPKKYKGKNS